MMVKTGTHYPFPKGREEEYAGYMEDHNQYEALGKEISELQDSIRHVTDKMTMLGELRMKHLDGYWAINHLKDEIDKQRRREREEEKLIEAQDCEVGDLVRMNGTRDSGYRILLDSWYNTVYDGKGPPWSQDIEYWRLAIVDRKFDRETGKHYFVESRTKGSTTQLARKFRERIGIWEEVDAAQRALHASR